MSRLKLPIIIVAVIAALGAGLFFSGMVGGSSGPAKKHVIEPITMTEPFTILLKDSDAPAYLATNLALQLSPMDEEHWAAFSGGAAGGHGGAAAAPGPAKVAEYAKFRDAVLTVASTYDSDTLRTDAGRADLKKALLDRFAQIAQTDAAETKGSVEGGDPTHVGPPYTVLDVYFTKYVVQKNG